LNVPWNDPVNLPALSTEVDIDLNPGVSGGVHDAAGRALTHFARNVHGLPRGKPLKLSDVSDGTSLSLFSGEAITGFTAWGQSGNTRNPALGLHTTPNSFGGPWTSGETNFSFLDGRVQRLNPRIDPAVLKALSTPAGGESVSLPWATLPRLSDPDARSVRVAGVIAACSKVAGNRLHSAALAGWRLLSCAPHPGPLPRWRLDRGG
jgi:hypothetical protein